MNGVSTEALIGSPATIISLEFVMAVLAEERSQYDSTEAWKAGTKGKFTPPQVSLKHYGGDRLDILAQVPLCITQGKYSVNTSVLVRKGAPSSVLLGTDVQSQLGFMHAVEVGSGKKVKLTSDVSEEQAVTEVCDGDRESVGEELEEEEEPPLVEEPVERQEVVKLWEDTKEEKLGPTGLVRLLSATKIPSGFKKMVRAKIEGDVWEDLSLFTPCSLESGLAMPDSVFERKDGPCVVLIVENHSTEAVRLEKGQLLGGVVPVAEVSVEEAVDEESGCEELGGVTEESVCALAGERLYDYWTNSIYMGISRFGGLLCRCFCTGAW